MTCFIHTGGGGGSAF